MVLHGRLSKAVILYSAFWAIAISAHAELGEAVSTKKRLGVGFGYGWLVKR
jgi:hypothetical protein